MFAQLPLEVLADDRLNRSDFRVLVALFSFASINDPLCWPSRAAISERCGIRSLALISLAIQRLLAFGWITDITPRRGSSLYTLRVPSGTCTPRHGGLAVHPVLNTEHSTGTDQLTPLPPEGEESIQSSGEMKQDPTPEAGDQSGHQQTTDDVTALVLAYCMTVSGVQPTAPRHTQAIEKALAAGYTLEQIKIALAYAATHWSNPAWALPGPVLRLDRLPELLGQAKAQGGGRSGLAGCHKPFERDPEDYKPRSESDRLAGLSGLAALKSALAA